MRVEALGDMSLLARHQFSLAHILSHLSDGEGSQRASLRAISVGERSGHVAEVGKAHYVLARESAWGGRYRIGVEHGARAVQLLEGGEQRWWLAYANSWLATNFVFLADFPAAFASAARASALGEALGDLRIQAYVTGHSGWFEALRGEGRRAIDRAQRALELSTDPLGRALATAVLGLGLQEVGDHKAAGGAFSSAIDEMDRFGYRRLVCWYTAWRAESWLGRGDLDTAERDARQALAVSTSLGSPWGAAICERTLGRVAAARGEPATAKAHFLNALSAFESVEANLESAVTHADLGELALTCSEPEGAHHLAGAPRNPRRHRRSRTRCARRALTDARHDHWPGMRPGFLHPHGLGGPGRVLAQSTISHQVAGGLSPESRRASDPACARTMRTRSGEPTLFQASAARARE